MRLIATASLLVLAACSPSSAEAPAAHAAEPERSPAFDTALPYPDVTGARWIATVRPQQIVYGKPDAPPFIALACEQNGPLPHLRLTRLAPAPAGAKAFFVMDGNGYIARWKVDATQAGDGHNWQGIVELDEFDLNALLGPRSIEATVPGAGTVIVEQNELPRQLVEQCRSFIAPPPPAASASPG